MELTAYKWGCELLEFLRNLYISSHHQAVNDRPRPTSKLVLKFKYA